jgi:hypothetical protein
MPVNEYELQRLKRIEENKARLAELGLDKVNFYNLLESKTFLLIAALSG